MIKTSIFDLCDTVVETAGVPGLLSLPSLHGRLCGQDIENWFVHNETFHAYERGHVDTDAFVKAFCNDLNIRVEKDAFLRVYEALVVREIDGMPALIQRWAHQYPLYALSNNNPLLWRATQRICSVLDVFSHVYLSHQIGALKPHLNAFWHVLHAAECAPEESILVDDNPRCIEAAGRIGMQTVHFKSARETEQQLVKLTDM